MRGCDEVFRKICLVFLTFCYAGLCGQGFSGEDDRRIGETRGPFDISDPSYGETLENKVKRLRLELEMAEKALAVQNTEKKIKSENYKEPSAADVDIPTGALVVVEGAESQGSGFIGRLQGKTFFITNIHVLGAARGAKIRTIEGKTVQLSEFAFISKSRDIAIIPIEWEGPVMEISPSLNFDNVSIGEAVTVMGNSDGTRVVTQLKGEILGIGPEEIQVSAKFVPGNSGSPIFHNELGTVIGVASYLRDLSERSKWSRDSGLDDIRRFAYRLDGEIVWERTSLRDLFAEGELFAEFKERTEIFLNLSLMMEQENTLVMSYREHDSIGYLYESIDSGFSWSRGTHSSSNKMKLRRFIVGLLFEIQQDRVETRDGLSLNYYLRQLDAMNDARDYAKRSLKRFEATRL